MKSDLYFGGKEYISVKQASVRSTYSINYIRALCRKQIILSRLVGKERYVSATSLKNYIQRIKNPVNVSFSEKLKGPLYIHYPKIIHTLSDSAKNHKSFLYDALLKRALLGSFMFLFAIGIVSNQYNPKVISFGNGVIGASNNIARYTVGVLTGVEGVAGETIFDGYALLRYGGSTDTTLFKARPAEAASVLSVYYKPVVTPREVIPIESTQSKSVSLNNDYRMVQEQALAAISFAQVWRENYDAASVQVADTVYESLRDVTDFYGMLVVDQGAYFSRSLLRLSYRILNDFSDGEQNIGNVAAAVFAK